MTLRIALSPRARSDLDDIWNHTQTGWGIDQAGIYIRQLWHQFELLAAQPGIGQPCPDIRRGYHKSRIASHVLFYRITPTSIEIIRILHERMNFERHLQTP